MIVDTQGRLLGKVNLLDLIALLFLLSLAGTLRYAALVSRHWSLEVTSVEPKRVVAGPGRYVMLKGTGFDQATTIQIGDYPPRGNAYFDESTIGMEIGDETGPGIHRIIVRDGRGRYVVLPDAVEVDWEPQIAQVRPSILYSTDRVTAVDIFGKFFTPSCTVRVGEQELRAVKSVVPGQISTRLGKGSSLALGEQAVTVTNEGGRSATLEGGVTVLPAPEVHSVAPNRILVGDTAELIIRGRHLSKGTLVWFEQQEQPLGIATFVSPECLKIQVTATPRMCRANNLLLELPNGPKLDVFTDAVQIEHAFDAFVVMEVLLDENSRHAVRGLKESLDWKLKRPALQFRFPQRRRNFNLDDPLIELFLPARVQVRGGKFEAMDMRYRPLHTDGSVNFSLNGQALSGRIVAGPFAVFADDLFQEVRKKP